MEDLRSRPIEVTGLGSAVTRRVCVVVCVCVCVCVCLCGPCVWSVYLVAQGAGYSLSGPTQAQKAASDEALAAALAAAGVDPQTDPELAAAIAESMKMDMAGARGGGAPALAALDPAEEMRRKRLARFG